MSYFDLTPPTRSSSTSTLSSATTTLSPAPRRPSADDLTAAARTIIESLSLPPSHATSASDLSVISTLTALISPDLTAQVNDQPALTSRDAYLASRLARSSTTTGVKVTVKEACVDEVQSKVWVRSEIEGVAGVREAVDMLTFDGEGVLVCQAGFERRVRRRSVDEED